MMGLALALGLQACGSSGPHPISYGTDQCAHCRMTISDARFGSQLVTSKGRAYHFDDVQCMLAFVKDGAVAPGEVAEYYLPDYVNANALHPVEGLFLLKSESLKSPMRGNIAAFTTEADLQRVRTVHDGELLSWKVLSK